MTCHNVRFSVTVLITFALASLTGPAEASSPEQAPSQVQLPVRSPADSLVAAVYELQREGRVGKAHEASEELLRLRRLEAAPDWKVEDAVRLLSTAEICLGMDQKALDGLRDLYSWADSIPTLLRAGRFEDARVLAEKRQDLGRNLFPRVHKQNLDALADLAVSQLELGNYAVALEIYEEAAAGFRRLYGESHPQTARAINNAAVACGYLGRYEEAVSRLRAALVMRERIFGPRHVLVGKTLHSLGSILMELGRLNDAEDVLRLALSIREENLPRNHRDVANTRDSLANLLRVRGNLAAAEPLYREAIAAKIADLGNDHPQTARSWNSLARLRRDQGFFGEARALHERALAIQQRKLDPGHPDVSNTFYSLGILERRSGSIQVAERYFRNALELRQAHLASDHALVAHSQNGLGLALLQLGRPAEAAPLLRSALQTTRDLLGSDHPDLAPILSNLARVEKKMGDPDTALALAARAVFLERSRLGGERSSVVNSFLTLARIQHSQGQAGEAVMTLAEAVSIYETARSRVGFGLGRATFAPSPHASLATAHLARGDSLKAWQVTERSLGRLLADLLRLTKQRHLDPAEAAREEKIVRNLFERERTLTRLVRKREANGENDELRQSEAELLRAQAEWAHFRDQLDLQHPRESGAGYSLQRVQAVLTEDEALIGWLDSSVGFGPRSSWAYVVRRTGPVRWVETKPSAEIADRLRQLLFTAGTWPFRVIDTTSYERLASALWEGRGEPLKPLLGDAQHLLVVADGTMAGIPLEALVLGDGRCASEHYRISYVPSATNVAWLRENPREGGRGRTLLVGDPVFAEEDLTPRVSAPTQFAMSVDPNGTRRVDDSNPGSWPPPTLAPLPGTRAEISRLAELLPRPTVWAGSAASEDSLFRNSIDRRLLQFDRIHIATHAALNESQPELSSLVLSASKTTESGFDGRVSVAEILDSWALDADLVTLSTCQSGLGARVLGESFVGLVQAILQAGARSVVVSLWPVDDRSTALFMETFYAILLDEKESCSKAEALRRARLRLRDHREPDGTQPFRHPSYWAPFVLIGDPS